VSAAGPGTVAQRMNSPVPVCGVSGRHTSMPMPCPCCTATPVTNLYDTAVHWRGWHCVR
jgi:hypothetical protein